MQLNYISFSNLVDWALYLLAVFFVMNFDIPYETTVCKGNKVREAFKIRNRLNSEKKLQTLK